MALSTEKLGNVEPAITTETDLYAPSGEKAVVSRIFVCEKGGASATFRVGIDYSGGSAVADNEWLFYDHPIGATQTVLLPGGIVVPDGDQLRVYASTGDLTFTAFGMVET